MESFPHDQKTQIALKENTIADALVKSFYFSKGDQSKQIQYLREQYSDLRLESYEPNQLIANPYVKQKLLEGFDNVHGKKQGYTNWYVKEKVGIDTGLNEVLTPVINGLRNALK